MDLQDVGVVIPTYNEEKLLPRLLSTLQQLGMTKLCIVDAESSDSTTSIAESLNIQVIPSSVKNKAVQMNIGAKCFETSYLLFLHADADLSEFDKDELLNCINSKSFHFGNFKLKFDSQHWFLKFNEKFSHFKFGAFQFGDQGLLVRKADFDAVGKFNENLLFMEGNDIIRRLSRWYNHEKIDQTVSVSARKYIEIGVFRLQFSYFIIYIMARLGLSHQRIRKMFPSVFGS